MLFPELAYQAPAEEIKARQPKASALGANKPKDSTIFDRLESALDRLENILYRGEQKNGEPELAAVSQRDRSADPDSIENIV